MKYQVLLYLGAPTWACKLIGGKPCTKSIILKLRVKNVCFGFLDTSIIA